MDEFSDPFSPFVWYFSPNSKWMRIQCSLCWFHMFFFIFSMSPTGRQADNGNSLPDCRLFYQNYTFFTKIRNSDYIFQKLSQAQLNPCRSQSFIYVSYVRPSSDSSQILLFTVKEMRTFKFWLIIYFCLSFCCIHIPPLHHCHSSIFSF